MHLNESEWHEQMFGYNWELMGPKMKRKHNQVALKDDQVAYSPSVSSSFEISVRKENSV